MLGWRFVDDPIHSAIEVVTFDMCSGHLPSNLTDCGWHVLARLMVFGKVIWAHWLMWSGMVFVISLLFCLFDLLLLASKGIRKWAFTRVNAGSNVPTASREEFE